MAIDGNRAMEIVAVMNLLMSCNGERRLIRCCSPPPLQEEVAVPLGGRLRRAVEAAQHGGLEAERLLDAVARPLHADAAQARPGPQVPLAQRHPLAGAGGGDSRLRPLLRRALGTDLRLRRLRAGHVASAVRRRAVGAATAAAATAHALRRCHWHVRQARRALRRRRPGLDLQRAPVVLREVARARRRYPRRRAGELVERRERRRHRVGVPLLAGAAGVDHGRARPDRRRPRLGPPRVHLHDLGAPVVPVQRRLDARRQAAAVRRHAMLAPRVVHVPLLLQTQETQGKELSPTSSDEHIKNGSVTRFARKRSWSHAPGSSAAGREGGGGGGAAAARRRATSGRRGWRPARGRAPACSAASPPPASAPGSHAPAPAASPAP
uniref:Uncharacterized protein n=1 Tax=Oryza brachyantha TaxID=4533 RepID=J3KX67_ORYBR